MRKMWPLVVLLLSMAVSVQARSDLEIERDVEMALRTDASVDGRDLFVTVSGGNVRVSGKASSAIARDAVSRIAGGVNGVRSVDTTGVTIATEPPPDDDVRRRVKERLGLTAASFSQVGVEVQNGQVILSGNVRTLSERSEVEREARGVAGVTSVQNNLIISPEVTPVSPR